MKWAILVQLVNTFTDTGYIKMKIKLVNRIRHDPFLLKKIEEYLNFDPNNWICPIIRSFCDHNCYAYEPKGFALLIKTKENFRKTEWSKKFKTIDELNIYIKKHTGKILKIHGLQIHAPYCKLMDAIIQMSEGICQNG
jgi:hypothetical protein